MDTKMILSRTLKFVKQASENKPKIYNSRD